MMPDFPLGETLDFKFTTRAFATGIPTVLAGSPVVDIYEDNSVTQITAGETLTVDFDSIVGLNNLRIVATSGNGYESGKSYAAVITTGTVGGVSVVGEVIAQFSIERSPALRPTTAGRTLDVTATGAAGVDWGNVENATTAVDLSATDIQLADTVTTLTGHTAQTGDTFALANGVNGFVAIKGDTAAILIDTNELQTDWTNAGRLDAILDTIAADVVNIDGDAMRGTDNALLAASAPTNFGDMSITVTTGLVDITQAAADKAWGTAARVLTANTNLNDPTAATVADAVWDEAKAGHVGAGSFGEEVQAHALSSEIAALNDIAATDIVSSGAITTLAGAVVNVDLVDTLTTYTGNTPQTGDSFARIGAAGAGLTNINLPNQTMDIVGDITGNLSGSVGSVTGNVGGNVTGSVGSVVGLTPGNLDTTVSSRATPAQVNTEVLDVMNVDTITLPGQTAPPNTPTHREAIGWLYKAFRNRKTQTATQWSLLANNETTVDAKATVSDDATTAIKQEIVSGP